MTVRNDLIVFTASAICYYPEETAIFLTNVVLHWMHIDSTSRPVHYIPSKKSFYHCLAQFSSLYIIYNISTNPFQCVICANIIIHERVVPRGFCTVILIGSTPESRECWHSPPKMDNFTLCWWQVQFKPYAMLKMKQFYQLRPQYNACTDVEQQGKSLHSCTGFITFFSIGLSTTDWLKSLLYIKQFGSVIVKWRNICQK